MPRAVLEAVVLSEGSIGSAERVARALGLRNRFGLARLLKREGLPPLHRLAAWTTILCWVRTAERDGTCLFRLATRWHRHPSACYRLVKEVTGLSWREVRARGVGWVERHLMSEFRPVRPGPWGRVDRAVVQPSRTPARVAKSALTGNRGTANIANWQSVRGDHL